MHWCSEAQTQAFAAQMATRVQRLAPRMPDALHIELRGTLGSGKTTFARALLHALGVQGSVPSPTYPLALRYECSLLCWHLDLFRLRSAEEFTAAGLADMFLQPGLVLTEWPERAAGALPAADWSLQIDLAGADARCVRLQTLSARAQQ